ncbi:hypothetical protein ACNFX6_04955 [Acinetobacter johnsonii]|jgi:hypothetical protein|uniref:hypothetical protein n=2 Tax=Acinetobacter TaxID=469 RepID=UPI001606509A
MKLSNYNKLLGYMYSKSMKDTFFSQEPKAGCAYKETINLLVNILQWCEQIETEFRHLHCGEQTNQVGRYRSQQLLLGIGKALDQLYVMPNFDQLQMGLKNKRLTEFGRIFDSFVHRTAKSTNLKQQQHFLRQEQFIQFYAGSWQNDFLKIWYEHYIDNLRRYGIPAEKFSETKSLILSDLDELFKIGKKLHVLSTVIRIDSNNVNDEIAKLHSNRYELLGQISVEGLLRNYYICLNGHNNGLDYFCIWVFETTSDYTEHRTISEIKTQCHELLKSYDLNIDVSIMNWNDNFNSSSEVFNKQFNLCLYDEKNKAIFIENCLDFLVRLDQDFMFKSTSDDIIGRENHEINFNENVHIIIQKFKKHPNPHRVLGDLTQYALFDLCWVQNHLDAYSKDYLKNIILQYQENLSSYATFKLTEAELKLLEKIEIFMLSVKYSRSLQPNEMRAQQIVERTLFQFVDLLMQHDSIITLGTRIGGVYRSRLLHYFFGQFRKYDYQDFLSFPFDHTRANFYKSKIEDFKYYGGLFKSIYSPTAITLGQNKHINIPRHEQRVEKIQNYLRGAFKRDCVLIRCSLSCEMKNGFMKQKGLSSALYQMLHAGKRRAPLSKLRAYVGAWVENDTSQMSDKRRFFADIVFVFDREVLNNYSNLADVVSERWQETLKKASEAFQPPLDLKASCRVKKIFNSVEGLAYQELLVESIDKPLKNSIINNLAPYIVYKDLLDNTFYSDTPKWLIRGTLPRKKKRKPSTKSNKADA